MERLTMLGTGNAMVTKCYNTCFTISDNNEHFLVDGGGGNGILRQLEQAHISISEINHVFVSHNHNDHLLGIIWIVRAVAQGMLNKQYQGNLNIYCHSSTIEAIKEISYFVLNKKFTNLLDTRIIFHPVKDGEQRDLLGRKITFFDIGSNKDLQYGFKAILLNGKSLTFLGDEPYSEKVKKHSEGVDYLLHEAFCLYEERKRFKPYEKHHATAKDACENAGKLNAKAVVLYHTEDENLNVRKKRYTQEGQAVYKGDIYVPDDLEVIEL